jgi:hypothetical protein
MSTRTIYHLKLRIRFVLSGKIARQKTSFLPGSGGFAAAPGLAPGGWYAVQSAFLNVTAY